MRGTAKICIHSEEDLLEAWSKIEKESCMLWCDGTAEVVKSSSRTTKRALPLQSSSESDDDYGSDVSKKKTSALQEKNSRIEEYIEQLKDKHQDKYSRIQYRLWAEMVDVGTHKSIDDAPGAPMFTAGGKQGKIANLHSHKHLQKWLHR